MKEDFKFQTAAPGRQVIQSEKKYPSLSLALLSLSRLLFTHTHTHTQHHPDRHNLPAKRKFMGVDFFETSQFNYGEVSL